MVYTITEYFSYMKRSLQHLLYVWGKSRKDCKAGINWVRCFCLLKLVHTNPSRSFHLLSFLQLSIEISRLKVLTAPHPWPHTRKVWWEWVSTAWFLQVRYHTMADPWCGHPKCKWQHWNCQFTDLRYLWRKVKLAGFIWICPCGHSVSGFGLGTFRSLILAKGPLLSEIYFLHF